jgi:ComF family protein
MQKSKVFQAAIGVAQASLRTVFPPACPRCGEPNTTTQFDDSLLCNRCIKPLILPSSEMCPRCALCVNPFAIQAGRCPRCRDERFAFRRIVCLGPYAGDLGTLIVRTKSVSEQPLTYELGKLIGRRAIHELDELPTMLVPMPMHWRRRLRRGYNVAQVLATAISRTCEIDMTTRLLRQVRPTQKQSLLSPAQRRENVRSAFAIHSRAERVVADRHIGLVDDAVTTGATVQSAAKVLRQAGASQVSILAVARANR